VANVAALAARAGGDVALAGGAGDDRWGRWLLERLERERVDVSLFELVEGGQTPLALVSIDADGEPSYEIYGEGIATVVHALSDRVERAVDGSAALFISSNTLVGDEERAVSMRARRARAVGAQAGDLRPETCGYTAGARPPARPRARTRACPGRCWSGRRPLRPS